MNSSLINLSVAQLRRAITIKEEIETLEKELASILGASAEASKPVGRPRKKRRMSAAAKAKIAAAQKARWAKRKMAKTI
jgi:hypothetical protein